MRLFFFGSSTVGHLTLDGSGPPEAAGEDTLVVWLRNSSDNPYSHMRRGHSQKRSPLPVPLCFPGNDATCLLNVDDIDTRLISCSVLPQQGHWYCCTSVGNQGDAGLWCATRVAPVASSTPRALIEWDYC